MPTCIGYVFGVFDLLNVGHLDLLRQASTECDELVVGVASDELVRGSGAPPPVVPEDERVALVAALRGVARAGLLDHRDVATAARTVGARVIFGSARGDAVQRVLVPEPTVVGGDLRMVELLPRRRNAGAVVDDVFRPTHPGVQV